MFFKAVQFLILIVAVSGKQDVRFALNEDNTLQVYTIRNNHVISSQAACIVKDDKFLPWCGTFSYPNLELLTVGDFKLLKFTKNGYASVIPRKSMNKLLPVKADCIVGYTPICNVSKYWSKPYAKRVSEHQFFINFYSTEFLFQTTYFQFWNFV